MMHLFLQIAPGNAPGAEPEGNSKSKNDPAEEYGEGYSGGLGPYTHLLQRHGQGEENDGRLDRPRD